MSISETPFLFFRKKLDRHPCTSPSIISCTLRLSIYAPTVSKLAVLPRVIYIVLFYRFSVTCFQNTRGLNRNPQGKTLARCDDQMPISHRELRHNNSFGFMCPPGPKFCFSDDTDNHLFTSTMMQPAKEPPGPPPGLIKLNLKIFLQQLISVDRAQFFILRYNSLQQFLASWHKTKKNYRYSKLAQPHLENSDSWNHNAILISPTDDHEFQDLRKWYQKRSRGRGWYKDSFRGCRSWTGSRADRYFR